LQLTTKNNYTTKNAPMNRTYNAIILIVTYTLVYLLIYFTAYTPVYIEGDDAFTVIYHLTYRNAQIQPPYSPYHSGFDSLLALFAVNEQILLKAGMLLSFVFGYVSLCLVGYWLLKRSNFNNKTMWFLMLLPFIIPELLFNSLLMNATNVGFACCMLALLFTEKYLQSRKWIYYIIVPVFYLIGIPFRWSLGLFLIVPLWIYMLDYGFAVKKLVTDAGFIALNLLSIAASIAGVILSGYSLKDIIEVFLWSKEFSNNQYFSLLSLVAHNINFITPAFAILLISGIYEGFRQKGVKFGWLIGINLIPYFLIKMLPCYKFYIMLTPFLFYASAIGFKYITNNKLLTAVLLFTIFCPWFFGIGIKMNNNAYGPGFEISNWKDIPVSKLVKNLDKRDHQVKGISLTAKGGLSLSTMEGPRPLYGFADVLFFGKWKKLNNQLEGERENIVSKALAGNKILVQDRPVTYAQCILYRLGYQTSTAYKHMSDSLKFRVFTNSNQDTLKLVFPAILQDDDLIGFMSRQGFTEFAILSSYSTILNTYSGNNLIREGPYTAMYLDSSCITAKNRLNQVE